MTRTSLLVPCLALGTALSTNAQTWVEAGEAGNLPATAQVPAGAGALTQIDGNINDPAEAQGPGNDRDMYLIQIDNPAAFTATTVGGTTLDTQLFLFTQGGLGVAFDDDTAAATQSALSGTFVPGPGLYYIAVSRFDRDPTGGGLELWLDRRDLDAPRAGPAELHHERLVPDGGVVAAEGGHRVTSSSAAASRSTSAWLCTSVTQ